MIEGVPKLGTLYQVPKTGRVNGSFNVQRPVNKRGSILRYSQSIKEPHKEHSMFYGLRPRSALDCEKLTLQVSRPH